MINDGEWWWLVGGIPTPLKNMSERQLGWNSQYDGKVIKLEKYESQLGLWNSQYMDMEKSKPCSKPPTSSYMTCMGLNGYESFGDPYGMER